MTILVIGSNGFLGSRIKKKLEMSGLDVLGSSRSLIGSNLESLVIEKVSESQSNDFEVIINASGNYSNSNKIEDLAKNIESNTLMSLQIAKLVTKATKKVINLGSYFEYAPTIPGKSWSQYALSKALGRITLEEYFHEKDTKFVSCILYDNYCEDISRRKFVDQLIYSIKNNFTLKVTDLNHQMDLINTDYLVDRIIEISLSRSESQENQYQIRSGEVFSTGEIIALAKECSGKDVTYELVDSRRTRSECYPIWNCATDWEIKYTGEGFSNFLTRVLT